MEFGLKDKVAIVSASSKGIGRAVALELASEGCKLAICARSKKELLKTHKDIEKRGVEVYSQQIDITNISELKDFVAKTREELGSIDILVTNAGGPPPGTFGKLTAADWKKSIDLNLMSVVRLCRLVLPDMKKKKWGRIVNLTSISVKEPIDNLLLSNTLRPGVVGFSKTLSREVGAFNITVNCVAPGYTATERLKELADAMGKKRKAKADKIMKEWSSNVPLGRLGGPKEIADVVVFLCSEPASYVSGTTIQVDGGMTRSLL